MTSDERAAILAGLSDAIARQDAAAYSSYYAAEAHMLPPNTPIVEGRGGIRRTVDQFFSDGLRKVALTPRDVLADGRLVVELGEYATSSEVGDGTRSHDKGKYVIVYERASDDGGLRIVVDAFNSDLPAELS